MADDANALLEEGHRFLEGEDAEAALVSFSRAYDLFKKIGDKQGALQALVQVVSTHHGNGDSEHAKQMAHDKMLVFQTARNFDGEVCMVEQYLNICLDRHEFSEAEAEARAALDRLLVYTESGVDTTAAEAYTWLLLSRACLGGSEPELAKQAAQKASAMFAGLGMHEQENRAHDAYNKADTHLAKFTQFECNKDNFYLGIRIGGLAYGPKYRNNHVINVNASGTACSAALQLTCDTEAWEDAVAYHAGIIDAGGHVAFARGMAPEMRKKMAAAPPQQATGPSIPFMMDQGTFTHRPMGRDGFFTTSSGTQQYMFSH